jgi:glycosyltransferase involved in cell wall biosynthesis
MKTEKNDTKIALFFGADFPPTQNGPSFHHYFLAKKLALNYKVYVYSCTQKNTILNKIYNQVLKFTFILKIINNNYDLLIIPLWTKQDIHRYLVRYFFKKPYIVLIEGSDFFDFTYPRLSKKGFLFNIYGIFLKNSLLDIVKGSSGVLAPLDIFQYLNKYNVDKNKYRLLPLLYDTNYIRESVNDNFIWKKDNITNILFFGRLEDNKGIKYLVNIIPAIIKVNNNVKFHIIGNGTLLYDLISYTKLNNISNYVTFYGYIDHNKISNYIRSSDVIINPSTWGAGLGMATIETLIMKKLLILGNVNITTKKIHEKYGCYILVEPKNELDLYEKLLEVLNNKKMNETVIKNIDDFIKYEMNDNYIKLKLEKIVYDSINYYKKIQEKMPRY